MEKRVYTTHSAEETIALGERLGRCLQAGDGVLFSGEMGVGKTHFTKGIAKALGVQDMVNSPTFAIVNTYAGRVPLYHFDLFRLTGYDDLYGIGFFDYLEQGAVCVVEWSEHVPEIEEEFNRTIYVSLMKTGDSSRTVEIKGLASLCEY